jgi:hypothetical protein
MEASHGTVKDYAGAGEAIGGHWKVPLTDIRYRALQSIFGHSNISLSLNIRCSYF